MPDPAFCPYCGKPPEPGGFVCAARACVKKLREAERQREADAEDRRLSRKEMLRVSLRTRPDEQPCHLGVMSRRALSLYRARVLKRYPEAIFEVAPLATKEPA